LGGRGSAGELPAALWEIRYFGECFAFAGGAGDSAELWGVVDFGAAVCGGRVVLDLVWIVEYDAASAASARCAQGCSGAVAKGVFLKLKSFFGG
jgi:hypothetical protein